jgi:hypothetical protein
MAFGLSTVQTEVKRKTPDKIVIYSVPGWGKTSLAAQFPKPLFLTTRGENGLQKLIANDALPPVPRVEDEHGNTPQYWDDVIGILRELYRTDHDYKYLVFDTANGIEEMLQQHVCKTEFGGEWGEKGYAAFGRGNQSVAVQWSDFLRGPLESLNRDRGMGIILLAHSAVREIKNPEGPDYSQFRPSLHDKNIPAMFGWADHVFFGGYKVSADKDAGDKTAKASGGRTRFLFTGYSPAREAKTRAGMPEEIKLGRTPAESFQILCDTMKGKTTNGN